jgi:hypothetical protein
VRYRLATLLAIEVCALTSAGHNSSTAVAEWARRCSPQELQRLGCPRAASRQSGPGHQGFPGDVPQAESGVLGPGAVGVTEQPKQLAAVGPVRNFWNPHTVAACRPELTTEAHTSDVLSDQSLHDP